MFKARFIHLGDAIDHTPSEDVEAGDVVVQGDLVGIARLKIAAGKLGALAVRGVFDVTKATGSDTDIDAGANVYWDTSNQRSTKTSSGNTLMGKAVAAAGDNDELVRVRLSQ